MVILKTFYKKDSIKAVAAVVYEVGMSKIVNNL